MHTGKQTQQGLTLIGFVLILMVVGIFAFLGMKLFPAYSENYGVKQALKAVQLEPGSGSYTTDKIRDAIQRKFDVGYIARVKQDNIKIKKIGGATNVTVKYEVREPLLYNLDYVAKFENSIDLTRK